MPTKVAPEPVYRGVAVFNEDGKAIERVQYRGPCYSSAVMAVERAIIPFTHNQLDEEERARMAIGGYVEREVQNPILFRANMDKVEALNLEQEGKEKAGEGVPG